MKLLAIVIVCSIAVQDSLAQVEHDSLSTAFVNGGNSVPASSIEGQQTENLRQIILNETALFITHVVDDLERQVNIHGHLQATLLKLAQETFDYEIEQMPIDSAADSLDLALQSLNQKIEETFNLIPTALGGNAISKPKKAGKKDKDKSSSSQKPVVHTLADLMNNLGQVLETDLEALYKFQKKLLTAAFKGVNTAYADLQEEFRTLVINEHLVPALLSIVHDVQANAEIAQAHVDVLTWTEFLALKDQLATIMATSGITEEPEVTEVTEANEVTEGGEVTEANEATEGAEGNEVTEVNEATEGAEGNEVTEVNEATEGAEGNEVTEVNEATEGAEGNEVTEVNEATEGAEGNEVTEVNDSEAPEVTEVIEDIAAMERVE